VRLVRDRLDLLDLVVRLDRRLLLLVLSKSANTPETPANPSKRGFGHDHR
jgi:hypothetical protein